jgi:hypothetical protein
MEPEYKTFKVVSEDGYLIFDTKGELFVRFPYVIHVDVIRKVHNGFKIGVYDVIVCNDNKSMAVVHDGSILALLEFDPSLFTVAIDGINILRKGRALSNVAAESKPTYFFKSYYLNQTGGIVIDCPMRVNVPSNGNYVVHIDKGLMKHKDGFTIWMGKYQIN